MKELEIIKDDVADKQVALKKIEEQMKEQTKAAKEMSQAISDKMGDTIDEEQFLSFFKAPYAIIPQSKKNVVFVAVPKFVKNFHVGWLIKETPTFYLYQFDQFSAWLGDAPKDLLDQINFKKTLGLTVEGNEIFFDPQYKDEVKKKLGSHLREIGENHATITRGHVFDVIAETIENGCLPFKPRSVLEQDKRAAKSKIVLRPYQKEAVKKFLETGATGIFHPTGAGKSFISLYIMDVIEGKKLLIVPTKTLAEQWNYLIDTYLPHAKHEIKISTYQGYRDYEAEYALIVYDECQRLPADTFSRLAVIKTKYRLGLSASPHREDGREAYIFALTGFPVGLNWQEYMATMGKSYHPINVHVVRSASGKIRKVEQLLNPEKKTLIFCDTIELGKKIASHFNIPFIYGQTDNRLEELRQSKVTVVSRVMDLGVSIPDLQRIIEVDFLFGSRQQELQRTGRLLHSNVAEKHDLIMTESEISQYGKRLWGLQEKGFTIKVVSE